MKTKYKLNLIRFISILTATLALSAGSPGMTSAQDYLGASNVLHQVEERNAKPADKREKTESEKLRDDLKSFQQSVTNLMPADAAQRWLDLADRAVKVQQQQMQNYNPSVIQIQPDDVLGALPPPTAWNALSKAIAARPPAKNGEKIKEGGLRLLAAVLTGDNAEKKPPNRQFTGHGQDGRSSRAVTYTITFCSSLARPHWRCRTTRMIF